MKKPLLYMLALLGLPAAVSAQNNLTTLHNQHWDLLGSRLLPSKLGSDYATVQVAIGNLYSYGGNNAFQYRSAAEIDNEGINETLGKLKPENHAGAGLDLDVLAFSVRIKKENRELFTASLMVTDRAAANLLYSENFVKLMGKGNKQFAGQRVNLGPLATNAAYLREYALGFAVPVKTSPGLGIRAGARLKYLQGFGAVYMPKSDAWMKTDSIGRYIEFDLDYEINTAFQRDANGDADIKPTKAPAGKGFAADLGLTFDFDDQVRATVSVLDLGSVTYKGESSTIYTAKGTVRYEGAEVDNLFNSPEFNLDSVIVNKLKGEETDGKSFSMPTSTRLVIQGEYRLQRMTKKHEREYNNSAVYLTYIQGLNNMPGAIKKPYAAIGYSHSFGYALNLGANVGYGGYNKLTIGSFISVRAAAFRLGFGSSNLTYLVAKKQGTGADLSFNLGLCF